MTGSAFSFLESSSFQEPFSIRGFEKHHLCSFNLNHPLFILIMVFSLFSAASKWLIQSSRARWTSEVMESYSETLKGLILLALLCAWRTLWTLREIIPLGFPTRTHRLWNLLYLCWYFDFGFESKSLTYSLTFYTYYTSETGSKSSP